MNLLKMSLSASVIILVLLVLRVLLINKLPKKVFLILWSIVLLRLLVPFSFPSMFSIYSLMGQNPLIMNTFLADFLPLASYEQNESFKTSKEIEEKEKQEESAENVIIETKQSKGLNTGTENAIDKTKQSEEQKENTKNKNVKIENNKEQNNMVSILKTRSFSVWTIIWSVGVFVCATVFSITYIVCCREFQTSLKMENSITKEWLTSHKIKRPISIRQSSSISAPLTYGIFRPVILMPKIIKWENPKQLQYILAHEFVHIQRWDAATKLFLIIAICIHWFNPFVWLMYIFVNRDIELSCDETVIRHFGEESKSAYALTLIHMEEVKSGMLLGSNFSSNAIEERITAIMKIQKTSIVICILAAILIIGVTFVFATSPKIIEEQEMASIRNTADFNIQNMNYFQKNKNQIFSIKPKNSFNIPSSILLEENQKEDLLNESTIDIETKLSTKEQKELLESYKQYGISENNGILYYQKEPIRCLIDKYKEKTATKYGGWNFNTIRIYSYFNQNGTINVCAIREDKTEGTELYKDIIDFVKTSDNNSILDMPEKSKIRLARKAAAEEDYDTLNKILYLLDTDIVAEIAKDMIEEEKSMKDIIEFINEDTMNQLEKDGY